MTPRFQLARLASFLFASSIGVALVACANPSNDGGCPWLHASAPSVAPATSATGCIVTEIDNPDGNDGPGGCVMPDVKVRNTCTTSLVVHGVALAENGTIGATGDVTIAPGETHTIALNAYEADAYRADATLGSSAIEISVSTSR